MKHIILFSTMLLAVTLHAQHTHQLVIENDLFLPEFLVVQAADPIALQLTGDHTLTEVSAQTFRAGGIVPNGGIHIGFGTTYDTDATTFTIKDPGEYYFVSEGRTGSVAKTQIVVIDADHTGISAAVDQTTPTIYPNPADDQVRFGGLEAMDMVSVEAYDQGGRLVLAEVVRGGAPLNIMSLPSGYYTLRLTDGMSTVYGIERLVINRNAPGL